MLLVVGGQAGWCRHGVVGILAGTVSRSSVLRS